MYLGTPQYFAPEVLKRRGTVTGSGRYGMSADMWSLGVVSYILLSGQFPFQEESLFEQIENATYSLTGKEWHGISMEAKHFIRSLMVLRTDQRMSVKEALKHPWILGITLPKRELSSVISGSSSTTPSTSAKRQASIRGKKLTANTGTMKKHATVFCQSHDGGEAKSTDHSDSVSRSTSTFQPLTSGTSRVLFWSLRTSSQGIYYIDLFAESSRNK
jgi:serine/threonine protein kinase